MNYLKKYFLILSIIIGAFLPQTIFSEDGVDEYKAFAHAKSLYYNGNYDEAKVEFDDFITTYKDTNLIKSKYPNYYIGMANYKVGNLKVALKYLESAIYKPSYYNEKDRDTKFKKKNYFEYPRAFFLGQIYDQLGFEENSTYHYLSLIKGYYNTKLEPYERKALEILKEKNPYYNYLYLPLYKDNFLHLDKLKVSDLRVLGKYFYSQGTFSKFYKNYLLHPTSSIVNKELIIDTLSTLEDSEEYDLMIKLIKKQVAKNRMDTDYFYFWGNALKKLGKFSEAIEKYKEVTRSPYIEEAYYAITRIYFTQGDYKNSIIWAKKLTGDRSHELLTKSYFNSGQIKLFKKSALEYIKRYPNSNRAGFYRDMLYKESKNPNYLKWIIKHNLNSYYYQVAYDITKEDRSLEIYPMRYKGKKYKNKINDLMTILSLGDPELLIIKLDTFNIKEDPLFTRITKTKFLEQIGYYSLAYKNSQKSIDEFSKFSNLLPTLYPRYYQNLVDKVSFDYDIESALIYSLMKASSEFDKNLISKGSRFGLMQLPLKIAKKYRPQITYKELLDPLTNIELSGEYLSDLSSEFDGNTSKVMAAFFNGEKKIKKWKVDKNQDISVEDIPSLLSQELIKKTMTNYYKYKQLYK